MVSMASAAITLSPDTFAESVSHDDSTSFTFTIFSDGECANIDTDDQCNLIDIISDISDLTGTAGTIGSGNISISGIPTSIANDTTSSGITVSISVPANQAQGDYDGTITIDGTHEETNTSIGAETISVTITVLEDKSLSITRTNDLTKTRNGTVSVTNDGNVELTDIDLTVTSASGFDVLFNDSALTLTPGQTIEVEISASDIDSVDFSDDRTFTIKANNSETESNTINYEVSMDFYEGENEGDLEVSDIEFKLIEGFGDDDEIYLYPFDEVKVIFNVDNKGDYDIEDIEIQVCLLNEDTMECMLDEDDMDISKDKFDLDEGEDKDVTLIFKIDADDLDQESEDYTLYIKAVGDLDGSEAKDDDVKGDSTGDSDSESIKIITDDEFALLDNIKINGMPLEGLELKDKISCGSELEIVADVWNIDSDDLEDVSVFIYNNELGIAKTIEIDEINDFDSEEMIASIQIPENAEAKYYILKFTIYEDGDILKTDEENDEAIFNIIINVEGNCKVPNSALITATLTSEAKAGKQLTVKTTITNTEDKIVTYILNVKDYAEWATLEDLESNSISLVAGESRDITLTFNLNKGAEGSKTFNIEAISDSEVITTQPVTISITPQKSLLGISLPGNSLYLWGIGAINVILILAIIVVAIRLSKD
jgi:uncharacterized membrane protein